MGDRVDKVIEAVHAAFPNYYCDDVAWNDAETAIRVALVDSRENYFYETFYYDEDDVFERDFDGQLNDWIDDLSWRY